MLAVESEAVSCATLPSCTGPGVTNEDRRKDDMTRFHHHILVGMHMKYPTVAIMFKSSAKNKNGTGFEVARPCSLLSETVQIFA